MTVASAKRRVVEGVCGCVVVVLLLGALRAAFECGRKVAPYAFRKFHLRPRKAEDAITPVAKDPDRHAQFLERSKQGDIDVVFLGDSITARRPRVGGWSWQKLAA